MQNASLRLALVLAAAAATALPAHAEVYRWVDKDGKVNYSDNPPPEVKADQRKLIDNKVDTDKVSFEANRAAQNAPITLYTSPDCKEFCDNARTLLSKRKVPFSEKSVSGKESVDALLKLTGSKEPRVPVLVVGSKPTEGFEAGAWNSALDTAGYPK
jgi:glutaredoxin